MKAADLDYLRNIDTRPGPNAGRSIDPTKPGSEADRIAELEAKIAAWHMHVGRFTSTQEERDEFAKMTAELSRLRNRQPKEGGAVPRPVEDIYGFTCGYCSEHLNTPCAKGDHAAAEDFAQEHGWRITLGHTDPFGGNAHVTCPNCLPAFSEAVTCSINGNRRSNPVPSPAPLPEPQDAREALKAARPFVEQAYLAAAGSVFKNCAEFRKRVLEQVDAALAQSDAQPVGWRQQAQAAFDQVKEALSDLLAIVPRSDDATATEIVERAEMVVDHIDLPAYTAPHSPDASGLIEAAEWLADESHYELLSPECRKVARDLYASFCERFGLDSDRSAK